MIVVVEVVVVVVVIVVAAAVALLVREVAMRFRTCNSLDIDQCLASDLSKLMV